MATNRFSDNISPMASGTGSHYAKGSFTSRRPKGLSKALLGARQKGKHTWAKNLSNSNLETIREKIGIRARKLSKYSKGFSRKTVKELNAEFRKEWKENPDFSYEDFKDAKKVVEAMRAYKPNQKTTTAEPEAAATEPTRRAVHFITDKNTEEPFNPVLDSLAGTTLKTTMRADTTLSKPKTTNPAPDPVKPGVEPTKPDIIAKREGDNLSPDKDGKVVDIDIG
ncbi:MAG: hypothetical protein WC675_05280 [Patescibacteria group bacterium]|jgi:hypothetical protein